jgi:hypothetical protein
MVSRTQSIHRIAICLWEVERYTARSTTQTIYQKNAQTGVKITLTNMYPKRNSFEMKAHDAQFKQEAGILQQMEVIGDQVEELKRLIG